MRDRLTGSLDVLFAVSCSTLVASDTSAANLFIEKSERAVSLPLNRSSQTAEENDKLYPNKTLTPGNITRMQRFVIEDASPNSYYRRPPDSDFFDPYKQTNKNMLSSLNCIPESQSQYSLDGLGREREVKPEQEQSESLLSETKLGPSSTLGLANVMSKMPWSNHGKTKKNKAKRKRNWEKRDIERMVRRYHKISNNRNNYYTNFWNSVGRTNPWKGMVVLIVWTTVLVLFDKNYLNWGKYAGWELTLGLS